MDPPEQKLPRRSTHDILDRLSQKGNQRVSPNTPWYTAGADFCFYAPAQDACTKSQQRLRQLKLLEDENCLLQESYESEDLLAKLHQIQAEQYDRASKRTPTSKTTSKFVNSFCTFAESVSNIVMVLLPQSPEYTVTFGMLFILFKAVVTKKDREESLLAYIENIGPRLPMMEFYKTVFPTDALKASVARIYVGIMKLLDEAIVYYRSWRFSKLIDAVLRPSSTFDDCISKIEEEIKTMKELKDAGHIAQAADMMEFVADTGVVVARLHESFTAKSNAIGTSMEIINSKLDELTLEARYLMRFETVKHASSLQDVLLPSVHDTEEDLEAILDQDFHLNQKDHWENNGVLEALMTWSDNERDQLLWVGGVSGHQDTWVTELSTDIVQALQPQLVTLLYVFCDRPNSERLTAMGLVRRLLVRLLDLHPQLAYRRPELCNIRRFQKAVTFGQLWRIFRQLAAAVPNLFIVIDRIEECLADEEAGLTSQLLPSIIGLGSSLKDVSVLVTSTMEPPEEVLGDSPFYRVYIDTSRKSRWT
ncbi:hypothetical protein B0T14DRAFT_327836 [Immersiella caudata]|uniref:Uncharacterized protein n=1 Tax=Immersiella caudata TaxID=314043 RepID=A0AA39WA92_9PEZI|nr:hypothetical protein B0T14DRAFT_327836 [Immersiella caudata]